MGGDEAMIVAGVGFRQGVEAGEIVALVEQALARASLAPADLDRLATIEALAAVPAFAEAARQLAVPSLPVDARALAAVGPKVRTRSERSLAAHGVGSVAEAAALGAAGPDAELILMRITSPSATCALARGAPTPEAAP
jgi:cobalt-precorrin 5A hydrolase